MSPKKNNKRANCGGYNYPMNHPHPVPEVEEQIEDLFNVKADEALTYAQQIATEVETWADYLNLLFNQRTGKIAKLFPLLEDRQAFCDSPQHKEIKKILVELIKKFGLLDGATAKATECGRQIPDNFQVMYIDDEEINDSRF
jgi:hypothetical protein